MNFKLLGATSVLATILAAPVQALLIDDFENGTFSQSTTSGVDIVGQSAGLSGSGFARTIDAFANGSMTIAINGNVTMGLYSHSQNAGVLGASSIAWDLGGINLLSDANAFRVLINSIDLSAILQVVADGVSVMVSTTDVVLDNGALPSYADFLFSDFAGVDFANVQEVALIVDGTQRSALDASFDTFETACSALQTSGGAGVNPSLARCAPPVHIPAPAGLALVALGILLTARRLRG